MSPGLTLRQMSADETSALVGWAAAEGWNPGLDDAAIFWDTDREAFIAADLDGELVGGGAITSYEGEFGFMGLFIMRPEFRGRGLGGRLWHARKARLHERLQDGAVIGMDGVYEMQDWYAKGGFVPAHRDIRFEGTAEGHALVDGVVPIHEVPFASVSSYDRTCFPAPRERFLRAWLGQHDGLALASWDGRQLRGYGVVRACRTGAKIGPLFADDLEVAEALLRGLSGLRPGQPLYLDVPEVNAAALELAARHHMRQVFGCARMYTGPAPEIRDDRVFGVTTFELG